MSRFLHILFRLKRLPLLNAFCASFCWKMPAERVGMIRIGRQFMLGLFCCIALAGPVNAQCPQYTGLCDIALNGFRWCPSGPDNNIVIRYAFGYGMKGAGNLTFQQWIIDVAGEYNLFFITDFSGMFTLTNQGEVSDPVSATGTAHCTPGDGGSPLILFRKGVYDMGVSDCSTGNSRAPYPAGDSRDTVHIRKGWQPCKDKGLPAEQQLGWTNLYGVDTGPGELNYLTYVIIDLNDQMDELGDEQGFKTIIRHELGHALGLDHTDPEVCSESILMNEITPCGANRSLDGNTKQAIKLIYGFEPPVKQYAAKPSEIDANRGVRMPRPISACGEWNCEYQMQNDVIPFAAQNQEDWIYDLSIGTAVDGFTAFARLADEDFISGEYAYCFGAQRDGAQIRFVITEYDQVLARITSVVPVIIPQSFFSAVPDTLITITGVQGQGFSPSAIDFVLSNGRATSVAWTATADVEWISVGSAGGTLAPGDTAHVHTELNASADTLAIGSHYGRVRFVDTDSSRTVERFIVVNVVPCSAVMLPLPESFVFQVDTSGSKQEILQIENSIEACQPLEFSIAANIENSPGSTIDIEGSATFWNIYSNRYIGNVYEVFESTNLISIEAYLDFTGSRELNFVVFEGGAEIGPYQMISSQFQQEVGTGGGFYSSGPLSIRLEAGKYYIIGTGWSGGSVEYCWDTASMPHSVSFGQKHQAIRHDGYPIPETINNPTFYVANYHQRLTTEDSWLWTNPGVGSVSPGEQIDVSVHVSATGLAEEIYLGSLRVTTNVEGAAPDSIPVVLFVGQPENNPACQLVPDSLDIMMRPDQIKNVSVTLENTGDAGSVLLYNIHAQSNTPNGSARAPKSIAGSTIICDESEYNPGQLEILHFTVTNGSNDDEWLTDVVLDFPVGFQVVSSTNFVGGSGGPVISDGSTGDGVQVSWHGDSGPPSYYGVVKMGESASAAVDVQLAVDVTGMQVIEYTIIGDQWGSTPHTVTGTVQLECAPAGLTVTAPNGCERIALDSDYEIAWVRTGCMTDVKIDLSRNSGMDWEVVTASTPNTGSYQWPVSSPASYTSLIRVSSLDLTVSDQSDDVFSIYEPAPWLTVIPTSGTLVQGQNNVLNLRFDTAGMAEGEYQAWLIIDHNGGGSPSILPISLHVDLQVGVQEGTPVALWIGANFPNPFNPSTSIRYGIPAAGRVVLRIYDLRGRVVRTILNEDKPAGEHIVSWDGRDEQGRTTASGIYFYRLKYGSQVRTGKMVLIK